MMHSPVSPGHRRVMSDPFEFDEPLMLGEEDYGMSGDSMEPLCDSMCAPFDAPQGNAPVNWGEVEDWLSATPKSHEAAPDFCAEQDGGFASPCWRDLHSNVALEQTFAGEDDGMLMSPTPKALSPLCSHAYTQYDEAQYSTDGQSWDQQAQPQQQFSDISEWSSVWSCTESEAPSSVWSGSDSGGSISPRSPPIYEDGGACISPREAEDGTGKTPVSSLASLLDKPLPPQVALTMLTSTSFIPGARPSIFCEMDQQWLFKERAGTRAAPVRGKQSKDEVRADRWHNSGGVRGSRDMPMKGSEDSTPVVRRRYGSIVRNKKIVFRYHEYSLIHVSADATAPDGMRIEEDRSTAIFHVMPKRTGKGRPSKEEANEPLRLWQEHPFGRTLVQAC